MDNPVVGAVVEHPQPFRDMINVMDDKAVRNKGQMFQALQEASVHKQATQERIIAWTGQK